MPNQNGATSDRKRRMKVRTCKGSNHSSRVFGNRKKNTAVAVFKGYNQCVSLSVKGLSEFNRRDFRFHFEKTAERLRMLKPKVKGDFGNSQ